MPVEKARWAAYRRRHEHARTLPVQAEPRPPASACLSPEQPTCPMLLKVWRARAHSCTRTAARSLHRARSKVHHHLGHEGEHSIVLNRCDPMSVPVTSCALSVASGNRSHPARHLLRWGRSAGRDLPAQIHGGCGMNTIKRAVLAAMAACSSNFAQHAYPNRPVTLVSPYPAGGTTETCGAGARHRFLQKPQGHRGDLNREGASG